MTTYTVRPGDSMRKIAVRFQVGVSEIIKANPQVKNPAAIKPGQKLNIPTVAKRFEQKVIDLTNKFRAQHGLPALKANLALSRVARKKAEDMRNKRYFTHQSPTYGSPFEMMQAFEIDFNVAGENIGAGHPTPEEVVKGWENSPQHRRNMLNS